MVKTQNILCVALSRRSVCASRLALTVQTLIYSSEFRQAGVGLTVLIETLLMCSKPLLIGALASLHGSKSLLKIGGGFFLNGVNGMLNSLSICHPQPSESLVHLRLQSTVP